MAEGGEMERIGDYAVSRVLGEGGMGIVYEATERLTGRRVALKVLHRSLAGRPDARARFVTEMHILTTLEHPSIVRCLSAAEIEGRLVMVLELLHGRTLREELEARGALPPGRAIQIAHAVASALAVAHARAPAIVHRDLKPENLMLTTDGGVKVMDFGIAKLLGAPSQTRATQAIGTAQYMSPEQAEGGAITERTDLYALGLVLYEMIAGAPPFQSPSVLGLLRKQCEEDPPPLPDTVRRQIPRTLEALLWELLEKKPERRPSSAASVALRLQQLGAPASGGDATVAVATAVATAAMARPPAMTGFAPARSSTGPNAGPGGKRADTIALLDRFDARRRRLALFLVAGGVILALGLVLGVRHLAGARSDSPKSKPKSSASARAAPSPTAVASVPPVAAPAIPSADICRGRDFCKRSEIPSSARADADAVFAEIVRFAVETDPNAKVAHVRFDKCIAGGAVDLTRPRGYVGVSFTIPRGSLYVDLREGVMRGMVISPSSEQAVLPPARCTFRQAYEAAAAKGFPFNQDSIASLTPSFRGKGPEWQFLTDHGNVTVDGDTCAVGKIR